MQRGIAIMTYQTSKAHVVRLAGLVATLILLVAPVTGRAQTVQADAADSRPVTLLDCSNLITGRHTTLESFLVPLAGTVTITLRDLVWPDPFATLSLALTDSHATLAQLAAPGAVSFDVSGPGKYFAFVFGQAQGALNMGLYSIHVSLAPSVAPVPLPAAAWLMLSGFAGLLSLRRRLR
jgi:hypothetical protein